MNLDSLQNEFILKFESWLNQYIQQAQQHSSYSKKLLESQAYSLQSGGKRFRPFLAHLVFNLFSQDVSKIKNFCLALEMIHTYSLIHDDLPCMDNDDYRRGKPTNHKKFSEHVALLAGDGLLTDVFFLLANDALLKPEIKTQVISLLAEKIGSYGMVAGQTQDMLANQEISFEELKNIHTLKTANLIQAAAMGAALIAEAAPAELHNISEFSHAIGMAFQIKDDLLDINDKEQDFKNYVTILGLENTKTELQKYSEKAQSALNQLKRETGLLSDLILFNFKRNA